MFGFYMSAQVIESAFTEWYNDPVITSLDSIAEPIDSIQFPTVTVCRDQANVPPDNWAFLENLLNFLAFKCYSSTNISRNVNDTFILHIDYNSISF